MAPGVSALGWRSKILDRHGLETFRALLEFADEHAGKQVQWPDTAILAPTT
jgi:hypothetical protein